MAFISLLYQFFCQQREQLSYQQQARLFCRRQEQLSSLQQVLLFYQRQELPSCQQQVQLSCQQQVQLSSLQQVRLFCQRQEQLSSLQQVRLFYQRQELPSCQQQVRVSCQQLLVFSVLAWMYRGFSRRKLCIRLGPDRPTLEWKRGRLRQSQTLTMPLLIGREVKKITYGCFHDLQQISSSESGVLGIALKDC